MSRFIFIPGGVVSSLGKGLCAAALGALFHDDATFVNRFGHYVRGVAGIVALHVPIHQTIYSDSTIENELIDLVAIGDGAVVLHFWSRLAAGAAHPAGPHEVDTLILAVLMKRDLISTGIGKAASVIEPTQGRD